MSTHTRLAGLTAALTALACTVAGCSSGSSPSGSSTEGTANLELVSWWTSGSEQQALDVLINDYKAAHPGVTVTNGTVAGGGGSNAQVVLAQRLVDNNPPDVWQTFPGGALRAYAGQSEVADVSAVYANGLSGALPKVILDGLTVDGKQYGVPTSSHRGNVLFFSLPALKKAGVTPPSSGYTAATFTADLAKLKSAGVTPLCLGAKDRFTTAALLENILLGIIGPEGWSKIVSDRFDWNGAKVDEALKQFGTVLDYADPQAGALSWDQATKKLAGGECGFESMNDSAFGELEKAGAKDGTDFHEVAFPGTESAYVAVVDTFVQARSARNAKNATDFLTVIGSPETQLAFSKAKGSVPVRTDVDVSSLTPYQQSAANALRTGTVVWSIVHGSAKSPQFQGGFYDAVDSYVRSRDAGAFRSALTSALSQQPPSK